MIRSEDDGDENRLIIEFLEVSLTPKNKQKIAQYRIYHASSGDASYDEDVLTNQLEAQYGELLIYG